MEGAGVHGIYKAAKNRPEDILFYQARVDDVKGLQGLPQWNRVQTYLTGRRTP